MLQLSDKNKKKIAGLKDYKDLCIESTLESGDKALSFLYPQSSIHFNLIEEEGYITTKENEYVIKEINPNPMAEIRAVLNLEDLEGKHLDRFESVEQPITACLNLIIVDTGWRVGKCNVTKKRTVRSTNQSAYQLIQDAKKVYRVDIVFNTLTKTIDIYEELGEDRGAYIMEDLNLRSLEVQSNTYQFYTRVIAEGKEGLTFESINGGKNYVENHQYSNKIKTYHWKDERYTVKETLKEDATALLEDLSKPYRSYGADIINLAKFNPIYKNILDFGLGDKLTLKSKSKKINEKQRITKLIEYPQDYTKDRVEIANTRLTFEDIQKEFEDVADTVDNITTDNGTVDGSKVDGIDPSQIKNFKANVVEAVELNVIQGNFQTINAILGNFGELLATKISATELEAVEGRFQLAIINKADITDLNATNGKIDILESKTAQIDVIVGNVADIKDIINGNLTSGNIQTGGITGNSLNMATIFIQDGNIINLNADKINGGEINLNKVKVKSEDGGIEIVGATQQFKDKNNIVRIQMGKDTQGNFNFILRGEDGTSTLIDHTGIKEKAIADNLIKENMIGENAVGEKAVDYNSFATGFNKDTNTSTLKGTKIRLDNENQTLDIAFNSLKSKTEGNTNTIQSHTTEINISKDKIQSLIADTTIIKDGQTVKLKDEYNKTVQTVNSMNNTISAHETTLDQQSGDIQAVTIKTNELERTVGGMSSTLTETTKKVETQSQQIINVTTTANQTKDKLDNLKFGVRNLLLASHETEVTETTPPTDLFYEKGRWLTGVNSLEKGKEYILTIWVSSEVNIGAVYFSMKTTDDYRPFGDNLEIHGSTNGKYIKLISKITMPFSTTAYGLNIMNGHQLQNTSFKYYAKFSEGTEPTDWTAAPEDTDQAIEDVTTTVTDIQTTVTDTTSKVNKIEQDIGRINLGVEEINKTTTEHNVTIQQHTQQIASKPNQSDINTAKNEAITGARKITDTRSDNQNPLWYIGTYPRQTITEFKLAHVVGIPNVSNSTYGLLETKVPWDNASGGYPVQIFRSNRTATYQRQGASDTAWSSWVQMEDTQGSQNKSDTAKQQAIDSANGTTETKLSVVRENIRANSSSIETMKNQIALKVEQTDIEKNIINMQIGVKNYLKNSKINRTTSEYHVARLDLGDEKPKEGETFTISIKGKLGQGKTAFGVYNSGGTVHMVNLSDNNFKDGIYSTTFKWKINSGEYTSTNTYISIYALYSSVTVDSTIEWVKLAKGTKATDWTPATEDLKEFTTTKITEAKAEIKLTTDQINLEVSNKVNSNAIVSTINQTAEAVKIKASKIELNGATAIGDTHSNHVKIENANYTIQAGGDTKALIGVGTYGTIQNVPRIQMGVYGVGKGNHELTVVCYGGGGQNPQGDSRAYMDFAYQCPSLKDHSNIKMYDGGVIRLAPLKELEITTNYTKGAYHGTWERPLAKFATKNSGSYEKYLEIQALVNTENYNGLVLADERSGLIETRVRVETGRDGNRYFCDAYNSGTVRLGASGYPWHSVTTKKGVSYSVVDNDGFRSVNIDRSIESVLDSINFDMDIHRRTNGDTIDNKLHLDIGRLKRHPMADIFLNRVTENISGNEAKEYVTADMTSLLHLALYEIQKLKKEIKELKGVM